MNFLLKFIYRELSQEDITQLGDIYFFIFSSENYPNIKFYGLKYRFFKIGKYDKSLKPINLDDTEHWNFPNKLHSPNFSYKRTKKKIKSFDFLFSIPTVGKFLMKKYLNFNLYK